MSPLILISIGLLLLVTDIFLFTVVLLWFGIGFIIVGVVDFFYPMTILIQILLISIITLLLVLILTRPLKRWMDSSDEEINEDFLNVEGTGEIFQGMVKYKGTQWRYESKSSKKYHEGDKVKVSKTAHGIAYIE